MEVKTRKQKSSMMPTLYLCDWGSLPEVGSSQQVCESGFWLIPPESAGQRVSNAIKPGVTEGKHQQTVKLCSVTLSAVRRAFFNL